MSGDERFFYGYAQSYRSKERDEALLQARIEPLGIGGPRRS